MRSTRPAARSVVDQLYKPLAWLWGILLLVLLSGGSYILWLSLIPFARAHQALLWLSPSHKLERLTSEVFLAIKPYSILFGSILIITGIFMLIYPERTRKVLIRFFAWLGKQFRRLPGDCRHLWQAIRPQQSNLFYTIGVLLIMAGAFGLRWLFLDYPMRYDESYTVMVFAMRPWLNLVSDYSLPNNHIFHTILVKLAIQCFGSAPWAVRLPALVHGILCIPAGYLLARQLFGKPAAILSAGLIADLPVMITYSTNARGYSMYMFYSLILTNLAIYLLRNVNLAAWLAFALVGAAGFYTLPFMLFPFGAVCIWMILNSGMTATLQSYGSYRRFIQYCLSAVLITALLSVLAYSPVILIGTGLKSLIANSFVAPVGWEKFWPQLLVQFKEIWANWNFDLPITVQIILAINVNLVWIFNKRKIPTRVSLLVLMLLWNLLVSIILRHSLDRVWLYLTPFWLVWAAGGFMALVDWLKISGERVQLVLSVMILLIVASWSVQRVHRYFPGWQADPGKIEVASQFISENRQAGDGIAVVFPYDAPYWYYLKRDGVPDEAIHRINREPHARVFAIVNSHEVESPADVLQAQGLSPEEYQADSAQMIYKINDQKIYLCLRR